jgi:hypothetical protein
MISLAACTYDWTVTPRSGDAGADGAAPDCNALTGAVSSTLGRAKTCTSSCTVAVPNECGCAQSVGDANPDAVNAYRDAARALATSGCTLSCPMCIAFGVNATCGAGACYP